MAGNDHLHDILRVRSGSKNIAVIVLWIAALGLGTLGMMLSNTPPLLIYLTLISTIVLIAGVCLWRYLRLNKSISSKSKFYKRISQSLFFM